MTSSLPLAGPIVTTIFVRLIRSELTLDSHSTMVETDGHDAQEVGARLFAQAIALNAKRMLAVGSGSSQPGMWLARALPPDGMLIVMEFDRPRAEEARRLFGDAGVSDRAHVIPGDPARVVHKLAGPFDLIFQVGDLHPAIRERIRSLLRPGGLMIEDEV